MYSSEEVQERRSGNQRKLEGNVRRRFGGRSWAILIWTARRRYTAVQDRLRLAPRGKARLPRILSQGSNKGPRMAATASPTQTNTPLHAPTRPYCTPSQQALRTVLTVTACPADLPKPEHILGLASTAPAGPPRTPIARSRLAAPTQDAWDHSLARRSGGGPFVSHCHYATACAACVDYLQGTCWTALIFLAICRTTGLPCPLSTADSNAPCGLVAF